MPAGGRGGGRSGWPNNRRLREEGETLVVRIDPFERDLRMEADPGAFFINAHYRGHPWLLIRVPNVDLEELRDLLEQAWRLSAPRRLVAR